MSREILSKAKRIDNDEWVEGYILGDGVTGQYFIHTIGDCLNESDKIGEEGCLKFFAFEVNHKTVCRYTGLTDKNEKKIWENDIVKLTLLNGEIRYFKVSIKSVVREVVTNSDFVESTAKVEITGVVFEWNGYELFPCIDSDGIPDYKKMEVVGNSFDNPELLEEG